MEIGGQSISIREVRNVVIKRTNGSTPIVLKVSGFPIGINKMFEKVWPKPIAPFETVRKIGKSDERIYNFEDQAFTAAYLDWQWHKVYFIIFQCLKVDTNVKFSTEADDEAAIRKIPIEMHNAGFSEGDVQHIMDTIKLASNVTSEGIKEAEKSF